MRPPNKTSPEVIKFLALPIFWTFVAVWFGTQLYFTSAKIGFRHISWWEAFGSSLADWYVYAPISVAAVWLCEVAPLVRGRIARRAGLHAFASVVFGFAYLLLRAAVARVQMRFGGNAVEFSEAAKVLIKTIPFSIGIYWLILSAVHAFEYSRELHQRELRTSELETRLAQAKLQALQMQLNPHFLFNTLHTISALMHSDVEAADRMVARLSELLRTALDSTNEQEVTLRDELNFLKRYLEIEQTRFRERLRVEMEIAPDTLEAQVPNLVLQPLVENAIRHGIEPYAKPGVIHLRALRQNGVLQLEVRDNGGGLKPGTGKKRQGIGVANTRARLQQLYGDSQQFELTNAETGGTIARIHLPFHKEPLAGSAKPA